MAFGSASERLAFVLSLDASNAVNGFKRVGDAADRELGKADNRLDKIGGHMQTVGAGAVVFAGVAGRALAGFAGAYEEARIQSGKLDQAIANSSQLAGESRQPFEDLAQSIQNATGADGDAVLGLEGLLGTFGRTKAEILELTPLVVDFAARYGVEYDAAARTINGAIEGNTGRLERFIGKLGDGETAVQGLQRTVGGYAEREGATFTGQMEILKQSIGDIAEGLGGGVVSAVNDFVGPITTLTQKFTDLDPVVQTSIGRIATIGTAVVGGVGALSVVAGSVIKVRDRFTDATGAINTFGRAAQLAGLAAAATIVVTSIQGIDDAARAAAEGAGQRWRDILGSKDSFADFVAGMDGVQQSIADLDADIAGSNAPWDADYRAQLREGKRELQEIQTEYGGTRQEIEELAAAEDISLDAATRQVLARGNEERATDLLTDALGEDTAALLLNEDALGSVEEQLAANRDRNNEARDAQQGRVDGVLGAIDADLRLADALRGTNDAIGNYNEVVGTSGQLSGEAAAALDTAAGRALDFAGAADEAARQNAELNGTQYDADDSARVQRDALASVAGSLDPGSPLRVRIEEYIARLGNIPRDIDTRINVDWSQVDAVHSINLPGGRVHKFHDGGVFHAPPGKSEGPAILSDGEIVIDPKKAVQREAASPTAALLAAGLDTSRMEYLLERLVELAEREETFPGMRARAELALRRAV